VPVGVFDRHAVERVLMAIGYFAAMASSFAGTRVMLASFVLIPPEMK